MVQNHVSICEISIPRWERTQIHLMTLHTPTLLTTDLWLSPFALLSQRKIYKITYSLEHLPQLNTLNGLIKKIIRLHLSRFGGFKYQCLISISNLDLRFTIFIFLSRGCNTCLVSLGGHQRYKVGAFLFRR